MCILISNRFEYMINSLLRVNKCSLKWHHNERNGVSNHRRFDCLFNRLFRRRSKKESKLRVTGLCNGNWPVITLTKASDAENVSILWRHHEFFHLPGVTWRVCVLRTVTSRLQANNCALLAEDATIPSCFCPVPIHRTRRRSSLCLQMSWYLGHQLAQF